MKKNRALFLDRDGIINEDVRYAYKPEQIRFRKGIFDLCRTAAEKGYLLIVVTNQAGVAKGLFTEDDVRALHKWIADEFLERGITITAFYYCPYYADATVPEYRMDSDYRKPKPGMFLQAIGDHHIDISTSLMIGDKKSDRIQLTGLKSIIVKSNYTGDDFDVTRLEDVVELL